MDAMKLVKYMGAASAGVLGSALAVHYRHPYILKDLKMAKGYYNTLSENAALMQRGIHSIFELFEEKVDALHDHIFLVYEGRDYTWGEVNEAATRVAQAALSAGLRRGDTVALVLHNSPVFMWTLIGFQKLGICTALINYNLRGQSLLHCIEVSEAKAVIVDADRELQLAVDEIIVHLNDTMFFCDGTACVIPTQARSWEVMLSSVQPAAVPKSYRDGLTPQHVCLLIYTSGTTGLPKAAVVNGHKTIAAAGLTHHCGVTADDRVYVSLPLYHSSGLLLGTLSAIKLEHSVVLKKKFSASHFWDDCRKFNVTVFLYIGELCRFLANQPPNTMDGKHSLRLIFGNGLRSDVWKQMIGRFRIPSVAEFYAATEGGASLLNTDNVVGAIGFMSPAISGRILKLIKFDIDKDQPIRDQKGFCVAEKHGKPGLLVVPVDEKRPFSGYRGAKKLTESKLLRNVFRTGDVYFNTGDLLVQDENYYVYFKDRVGDTFRWRGENVATMEVAQIISELEFVADVCVYGVKIHGEEGRAGMASIILKSGQPEDYLRVLYDHIIKYLPSYARPLFLRFHKEFELTGTFKQKKTNLVKEGYDPQLVPDPLFYLCSERNSYTELKDNHRNLTTSSHGLKYVNAKL